MRTVFKPINAFLDAMLVNFFEGTVRETDEADRQLQIALQSTNKRAQVIALLDQIAAK